MTSHKPPRAADTSPAAAANSPGIHPTIDEKRTIRVYQSSSQTPNMFTSGLAADEDDDSRPWLRLIEQRPLIERIDDGLIYFKDGSTFQNIDVIIFATGYLYYYPFFKRSDHPWSRDEARVLDKTVERVDVIMTDSKDMRGLQGLGMSKMDELMLFLANDRSMALIGLRKSPPSPTPFSQATLTPAQHTKSFPSPYSRSNPTSSPSSGPVACPTFHRTRKSPRTRSTNRRRHQIRRVTRRCNTKTPRPPRRRRRSGIRSR